MRYDQEVFLTKPIGNNTINFLERKEKGSDCILRVPPLIHGSIDDVHLHLPSEGREGRGQKQNPLSCGHLTPRVLASPRPLRENIAYEYVSNKDKLISSFGLESLVHMSRGDKDMYIIDNHNHAFYCRWKCYLEGKISRGSHLIHIDQHSDLNLPRATSHKQQAIEGKKTGNLMLDTGSKLEDVAIYTNEVLDIASFIKPAKEIGLISDYEMVLTEYSLLPYQLSTLNSQLSTIIDIDLDFRAPEMGIEYYYQTIKKVRQLIALPDVGCITIATSPTYIHQQRALEVLRDIMD